MERKDKTGFTITQTRARHILLRVSPQLSQETAMSRLGDYKRRDEQKTPNDPNADSDGYGTGFVTYVLLQAGVPTTDASVVSAVKWIKANQRESGRWFTRSLNNDKDHFITNAGSAYCVLALGEAGEKVIAK